MKSSKFQDVDLSKMSEDGSLRFSMKVILLYIFLSRALVIVAGSLSAKSGGNKTLGFIYPDSDLMIAHLVFAAICLISLQLYVFAKHLAVSKLSGLLAKFRVITATLIIVDILFLVFFQAAAVGWFVAGLQVGVDLLLLMFVFSDKYLQFYVTYYAVSYSEQNSEVTDQ